ncbi:MAG: CusA/CzcA family heavy metal efflux RND transporter [Lewinellaceae bacterium]|nr:CusA/CzcA family heavy metal efflux RND transporter [Saprospiraceae bacterium]MCB9341736.1 CusA/CzcA family heavy metal efflux RND transporter [Lewinellaceae bacterium]
MLDKIIHFSIHNKLVVGLFTLALAIWGTVSFLNLPLDAVPDITNNQVQIISQAPTLGAQEVEAFITAPIERALANIPDVTERRSISRSGLSVITIVFHDGKDIYWARQQVGERLKEAENEIPKGLAEPMLAPITTGLGEIYHYTLHTKPGFEDKYTATDLRTFQDWIVKRQLEGTPGVAEVSGWGGYVKQYEIAVDPDKLNALDLTMNDVFDALENNNENTGGSYIEKGSNLYFIRGIGLVKTLQDIEKIVVTVRNGIPILVRNVGTVQFGSVNRLGAVTRNGEGETVAGITLMLKGADFNQVIARVKEKVESIQKSLPEGVVIEPFIDRTELVGRTIGTVEKNLLEGGLIVVFVLVLLLGNLRAGLVVASVIPLAMLFAFGMMRLFGVSGNLMSLGAIDFGLLVDAAVIIVEAIVYRITGSSLFPGGTRLTQRQMDEQVYTAASKIRNSAAFGEIIILIVYLPILALVGIEGKMFRPMAMTVGFAILGAFLLSLTWVPMASALFLSKKTEHKANISDHIMAFFHKLYSPALEGVLRWKKLTASIAVVLFALALWGFSRMGGEFIPTLEEGDLTVEFSMMQGTSLTQMMESTTKAEEILMKNFPEVKQVVSRIGSAEIPTDPMPVERGDIMVSMKPKDTWREEVCDREEMQEAMEKALSALPGVSIEMTQPMQMRFNELMTGIKQDVAVKIFGDDLDVLADEAARVAKLIAPVRGVSEPIVERVKGLPQIQVTYDRDKLAQFGLDVAEANRILTTAYAGSKAGVVFEGEKRFDMVVRLERSLRQDISNLENLYVSTPGGGRVPLNQIATIEYKDAPAQVSRENAQRRIVVGFNVRGRDVESTVEEIESILQENLKLPTGYHYTFGGQFQNLREAKARLSIAVPLAMALIFVLLFFTFHSVGQAVLIFTAVPLSAIGGVAALMLRGMPFSISAGVGFIALFGVAVLNGIVLIGYFNQLKAEGVADLHERIRRGTYVRLRPVIMTAAVASLGFLPMALSTGDGAEVQRPLATVVIGGLISATLLTLLVLPILYIWFEKWFGKKISPPVGGAALLVLAVLFLPKNTMAQTPLTLDAAISQAKANNPQIRAGTYQIQAKQTLRQAAYVVPKTSFDLEFGQYNSNLFDQSIGIRQEIPNPRNKKAGLAFADANIRSAELFLAVSENELVFEVRSAWYELAYLLEKQRLLESQDSLLADFVRAAEVRLRTGETNSLERATAVSQSGEVRNQLAQVRADIQIAQIRLQTLLAAAEPVGIPAETRLEKRPLQLTGDVSGNPALAYFQQQIAISEANMAVEKARRAPDFSIGYLNQSLITSGKNADPSYSYADRFHVVQAGISIPIFAKAQKARTEAAQLEMQVAQASAEYQSLQLEGQYRQALQEYEKQRTALDYFEQTALPTADLLLNNAQKAFRAGDVGYLEYVQALTRANDIRLGYLETLNGYNGAVIAMEWLTGK